MGHDDKIKLRNNYRQHARNQPGRGSEGRLYGVFDIPLAPSTGKILTLLCD